VQVLLQREVMPLASEKGNVAAAKVPLQKSLPCNLRRFLQSLPKQSKIPFTEVFPKASALACDLLDKLKVTSIEMKFIC